MRNFQLCSPRFLPFLIFSLSFTALGVALWMQYGLGMQPCTWCVIQRFFLLVVMAGSALWTLMPEKAITLGAKVLTWAGAAAGVGAAGWHSMLMLTAGATDQTCGSDGFLQWVDGLWVVDQAPWLLAPMGDCFKDSATLWFVPLPVFVLILFVQLLGLSVFLKRN